MLGGLVLVLFPLVGRRLTCRPSITAILESSPATIGVSSGHTLVRFQTLLPVGSENSIRLGSGPDRIRT